MGFVDDITAGLDALSARAQKTEDALLSNDGDVQRIAGTFRNGEDLTAPPAADAVADVAVGDGGNALSLPELIEFIHYGRVNRDDAARFASSGIADDDPAANLAASPGAHGLIMRAALMREALLLSGFARAQMAALVAEENSQGSLGSMMSLAAELVGAAGSLSDKPSPDDFDTVIDQVKAACTLLNGATIDYPALHDAAIKLHNARAAYAKILADQLDKRMNKKAAPGTGLLDAVPLLSSILPPFLADVLTVIQKIAFKVYDVYAALVIEIATRMEPSIEAAARDLSLAALRDGRRPIFAIWYVAPPPGAATPTDWVDPSSLGPLAGPLGGAISTVNDVGNTVQEVTDFLSRPGGYTPGSAALDQALKIPATAVRRGPGQAALGMSDALGQIIVDTFEKVLDVSLPKPVATVLGKLSTVVAEFLRAIYSKLITLQPTDGVAMDEFRASGRVHLVNLVVEKLLELIPSIDTIRGFAPDFQGLSVNVEALLARGKELIAKEVAPAIDPVIDFAMRDLFRLIFSARNTGVRNNADTMETTLALAPVLFARLFRNLFFPIWDLLMEQGLKELTRALGFDNQDTFDKIHAAKREVDMVSDKMKKASAILSGTSLDANRGAQNLVPFQQLIADYPDATSVKVPDPLAKTFPLLRRVNTPTVAAVDDAQLKLVEPNLKWQEPLDVVKTDVAMTSDVAASAASGANGDPGATAGPTPGSDSDTGAAS